MQPRPGAEIEQLERPPAPALLLDDSERRLDQRLGVGTRVERARIDAEAAAVELADADDAGHRLALRAAARPRRRSRAAAAGLERVAGPGDIGLVAQPSGMAEQQPRVELRRVDAGRGATPRRAPRRRPGSRSSSSPMALFLHRRRAGWSDAR